MRLPRLVVLLLVFLCAAPAWGRSGQAYIDAVTLRRGGRSELQVGFRVQRAFDGHLRDVSDAILCEMGASERASSPGGSSSRGRSGETPSGTGGRRSSSARSCSSFSLSSSGDGGNDTITAAGGTGHNTIFGEDGSAERVFSTCTDGWKNRTAGAEETFHFAERPVTFP